MHATADTKVVMLRPSLGAARDARRSGAANETDNLNVLRASFSREKIVASLASRVIKFPVSGESGVRRWVRAPRHGNEASRPNKPIHPTPFQQVSYERRAGRG